MNIKRWLGLLRWKAKRSYPDYQGKRFKLRLLSVQEHLAECLDHAPSGPLNMISVCAGDGQDVIGVLGAHRRQKDVSAWLIEINPCTVADGVRRLECAKLNSSVKFLTADATAFATYKNMVPADIVMLCGVWGHVPPKQRAQLIHGLACLCKPGASVIWTRGISNGTASLHEIQKLCENASWKLGRINFTNDGKWCVATYRYAGLTRALPETGQMFHFRSLAGAA